MPLFKHQFMKFSRSEFKLLVSSRIEESEDDRVASSANRSNIQNCNVNGKSFTYRRNSIDTAGDNQNAHVIISNYQTSIIFLFAHIIDNFQII